jgi:hypothetical protein
MLLLASLTRRTEKERVTSVVGTREKEIPEVMSPARREIP